MHPDIIHLAERLVIAMETMSQDVRNMSAYVHDISCSVSYLLNEKQEKECISVPACNERDNPPNVRGAAWQETSAERAYSGQYEQMDDGSSSYFSDPERREDSFGYMAPLNIAPHENSNDLPSESQPTFTGGIKIEELAEVEEIHEPSDVDIMYRDSGNDNRDCTAVLFTLPEQQTSVARTPQIESAEDTLMAHLRVDSEDRPYVCPVCGHLFRYHYDLLRHTRVHTGEKPHKCNVCGKGFSLSGNLTIHMRLHTGEKPYKCNICGKTFRQKPHLTAHIHSHTGEYKYKCNSCGKTFRQRCSLNYHLHTHSREHLKNDFSDSQYKEKHLS